MKTPHLHRALVAITLCSVSCTIASFALAADPGERPRPSDAGAMAERTFEGWRSARGISDAHVSPPAETNAPAPRPPHSLTGGDPPPPDHWQPRYGLPVPDGGIEALLPLDFHLIAGGHFRRIGRLEAPGLAAWNGGQWSLVGDFPGTDVVSLAPYVGGFIALSAGASGAQIWRWTGPPSKHPSQFIGTWQAFDPPLPSGYPAIDMAVTNDTIAVSVWANVSGEWHSRVLLHAGRRWTTLGEDFPAPIFALAWFGGALYAGGPTSMGGASMAMVSRWNGSAWEPMEDGLPGPSFGGVRALAVYRNELVAAGAFGEDTDPTTPSVVARWNGSRWVELGTGGPDYPFADRLKEVGTQLYALGGYQAGSESFGIARWDGSAWHMGEDGFQTRVRDVANYQGRLYAGGWLSINGSGPATPLMVRDGDLWRAPRVPAADMHGFLGWSGPMVTGLALLDGAVLATGRFDFAGTAGGWRRCAGAARWDGSEWSSLGFEAFSYAYPQDLTIHQGTVYVAGTFGLPDGGYGNVVRLDGGTWRLVGTGSAQPFYNIYSIASALGDLFVVGSVDPGTGYRGIARWDGSAWQTVGGGVTVGNSISAITAHGSDVIVAGAFEEMGGVACRNIAAWNPVTGWRPLGTGLDGDGYDLLSRDGTLYVAGGFSNAGGVDATGIGRWQDGHWESLPAFLREAGGYLQVWSLGWYRGRLVASGWNVPGMLASLESDGTWRSLSSGLNNAATAMIENGPSLFVAGFFSQAGGSDAYGFAEWRPDDIVPPLAFPPVSAEPNPFASSVHLRYDLPTAARVRLEIFDLAGHKVDEPFNGFQGAGPQDVTWNAASSRTKAGVYFARLTTVGSSRIVRVVRVP